MIAVRRKPNADATEDGIVKVETIAPLALPIGLLPNGRCRARTSDLLLVRQALSQLS